MTRTIRAIASAALAAAFFSSAAGAQTSVPDPDESDAKATEEIVDPSNGVTPTPAKPKTVKPAKRNTKPFKPTDRIEAESVISFPSNI